MNQIFNKSEEEIIKRISEISKLESLSGNEILRARYMQQLFDAYGIKDVVIDTQCNVLGVIKGTKTPENIIIIGASLDSESMCEEPLISLKTITARGISDALALYGLSFLGELLKKEKLNNSILIAATSNSKTRRTGLNHILNTNINKKIKGYINVQGIGLGEVKSRAIGEIKLKILFRTIENNSFLPSKEHNVVKAVYQFLSKIFEEDFNEGIEYEVEEVVYSKKNLDNNNSAHILVKFTGISLDDLIESTKIIEELAKGASLQNNIHYSLIDFGEHKGAFLRDSVLENIFVKECTDLNIKASTKYTNSEISETLLKGIDSVTIGLAEGKNYGRKNETIDIRSVYNGMIQLYKGVIKFDKC